jgi:hypothetical protein
VTVEKLLCNQCNKEWSWDTDSGDPTCENIFGCKAKVLKPEQPLFTIMNVSGGWQVTHVWRETSRSLYLEAIYKFKSLDGAVNYVKSMQEVVK